MVEEQARQQTGKKPAQNKTEDLLVSSFVSSSIMKMEAIR
jgi:hypothetical protein